MAPITIQSSSLLAVEGKDEYNFFYALLQSQNLSDIQLVDMGGKDKFQLSFSAMYNLEGFRNIRKLGFVRDAETGTAQSAFFSICSVLEAFSLPVPTCSTPITVSSMPRVGIYIMPNNIDPGMLEDLCLQTIRRQPVNACIDDFMDCFIRHMDTTERNSFNSSKARVQAYLTTRSPLVNSLGLGALKGYWDFAHERFKDIKAFLCSLFQESA